MGQDQSTGNTKVSPAAPPSLSAATEKAATETTSAQQDGDEETSFNDLERDENPVIRALKTMTLPPKPPRADFDLKEAVQRRTRIVHGRAKSDELHQPLRIVIYLCYSELSSSFEAKCIRDMAHPFLQEWCRTEHEITVDIVDIHAGLSAALMTSQEVQQLHLNLVENMVKDEVSPIFLRIGSVPHTFGSYVVPSFLTPPDVRMFSDEDQEKLAEFYMKDANHSSKANKGVTANDLWLKEGLSTSKLQELLDFLVASPFKKELKTLEQLEMALVQKSFPDDAVVYLEMTNVSNDSYRHFPNIAAMDKKLRARAPALNTAQWKRPSDMPFGPSAIDFEQEKYAIAVSRSYVVCIAYSIVAGLSRVTDTDSALLKEFQEHIGYAQSLNATAEHLPRFFSEKLVRQYLSLDRPAPPLVIHSPPGGGRTTAAAQIAALALSLPLASVSGRAVVPRFAGLTSRSSNLQSFLHDLNRHLCMLFDGDHARQPTELRDLVKNWTSVFSLSSPYLPLVMVFDVDMFALSVGDHAVPLSAWLPKALPNSIKIVLVTDTESADSLRENDFIPSGMFRPLARSGLTLDTLKSALVGHLQALGRTVSSRQMDILVDAFPSVQKDTAGKSKKKGEEKHISPLHIYVLAKMASTWASSEVPEAQQQTLRKAVATFIDYLEKRHSQQAVEVCLLSMCVAQEGLSDLELASILARAGISGSMLVWFRVRQDLGLLIQYHGIHHLNKLTSEYFADTVLDRYGEAKKQSCVQLLMGSLQSIVRLSGASDHIAMELLRLLHAHGRGSLLADALCEPLLFLKLVSSAENFATIKSLWSSLSMKEKRRVTDAAFSTILASIKRRASANLKQLILRSNAIAAFVNRLGDKELGVELFTKTLDVQVEALGVSNAFTLGTALKVATIMFKNGESKKAVELCRRFLKDADSTLSSKQSAENKRKKCKLEVTPLLLLRSNIYLEKNEIALARKDLELVLKVYELYGISPSTPDMRLCAVWGNLANVCTVVDDYEAALDFYARALSVYQNSSTSNPRKVCTTHLNIALAQRQLNKYDEAIASAQEAHKLAEMVWGIHDNLTMEALHSIAVSCEVKGDWAEALTYYQEAQEGHILLSGNLSPHIARSIARCELELKDKRQGKKKGSKKALEKSVKNSPRRVSKRENTVDLPNPLSDDPELSMMIEDLS